MEFSYYGVALNSTAVQVERGTTATYLSSDGGNSAAMARLVIIRRRTDRLIDALSGWPPTGLAVSDSVLHNQTVSEFAQGSGADPGSWQSACR